MRPGTANNSRPCSPAKRAVIIAPPSTSLSTTMVAANLAVDLLYGWLDPRMRAVRGRR